MGLFSRKPRTPPYDHEKARLARNLTEAEIRHLELLRREIANLIVEADPDLMVRCYEKGWAFEREIAAAPQSAEAEEAALVAKFPMFSSFDLLGTRHFVPYHESRSSYSNDDLVERYHEISRMLVFVHRRGEFPSNTSLYSKEEAAVLHKCMERELGRRFCRRIDAVMQRFYIYQSGIRKGSSSFVFSDNYEDNDYALVYLPYAGEDTEYGITLKKTEEFGVYSSYTLDSGKESTSYYRTNSAFGERRGLLKG